MKDEAYEEEDEEEEEDGEEGGIGICQSLSCCVLESVFEMQVAFV